MFGELIMMYEECKEITDILGPIYMNTKSKDKHLGQVFTPSHVSDMMAEMTIEDKNAFKLYHLFGAHPPYTLDENGYLHDNGTSQAQQIEGVFKVVRDYIHAMKEQDLYDKSTILIVADHGAVDIYQNPMLLIKSENHTQDQLEIRHAPVSFKNILPTLSSAIDGINDEQERSLFEIDEEEQVTRYQVASPALVKQYYQQGDWDYPVRFSVGNPARNTDMLQEIG